MHNEGSLLVPKPKYNSCFHCININAYQCIRQLFIYVVQDMIEEGRKMAEKALKDGIENGEMIANRTLAEMVEVSFYIIQHFLLYIILLFYFSS